MAGTQAAWGIDVGVSSLKALKLRRDGDRVAIEAFDVLEHDKFLSEPDVDRDALIRGTLQKFMNKHSVRRDMVFIGVPGSSTFARFVKLPPVETKKIPEIVRFEAIQQIPFPLEQVNWDYHTFQHPDSPDVEVGIFAMKKELVAHVMSNFRAVEMMVHGVQMSPLAVYNAAAYDEMTEDKGTVIIDMGAEHTDIVIMDQGRVWLRSISTGGNHFTDALAKSFKQQFSKAESLKKQAATSKYQKQIYQAMRPIFADLVAEIQRSLGAYNSSHRDSRLERIVCMGNPFKLPNLQKYLQQELKMEVTRLENFRKATVEKAAAFSENILSMSTAYGLALQALDLAAIETNLLPTEIARSMMWKKKQPWFVGASALLAVGALAIGAQAWSASAEFKKALNTQGAANDAKMADASNQIAQWDGVSGNYDQERQKAEAQMGLLSARRVWPGILVEVLAALPPAPQGQSPLVVITDMTSEYTMGLAGAVPVVSGAGGGGMPSGGGLAGGTATMPSDQAVPGPDDPTDHGFMVTISGYTRTGSSATITQLHDRIIARAPEAKAKTDPTRGFYFAEMPSQYKYGGHVVRSAAAGFGAVGGFGGGGATTQSAAGAQLGDKPWGNVRGPYWEVFFQDVTGLKTAATTNPSGMMPSGPVPALDMTDPLDLVATRFVTPPSPQTMEGRYVYFLRFKVFIKNEIR